MIDPNKLKRKLIHEGLEETDHLKDRFLINKHIDRHLESFRFLRSNNLPLSSFMLTKLYRADVVVRQEMNKVLVPIELSIATKLQYYIEEKNIVLNNFLDGSIFEPLSNINKWARKKRWCNNEFVKKSLKGLGDKWLTGDIKTIIFKMTFGQISAIINALPEEASIYVTGAQKTIATKSLENIVNVRNYIAHLGQLFINGDIPIKHNLSITLPDLVNHIAATAYGTYAEILRKSVTSYAERVMRPDYITPQQKENLISLFTVIQDKLFGV